MKAGSFIIVLFLWVEFIAILYGSPLCAQQGGNQPSAVKNNFTSFTRKYTNRGKLWMARNKETYLRHPDTSKFLVDRYTALIKVRLKFLPKERLIHQILHQ